MSVELNWDTLGQEYKEAGWHVTPRDLGKCPRNMTLALLTPYFPETTISWNLA